MKTIIEDDDGITVMYQTLFYEDIYEKVTCISEKQLNIPKDIRKCSLCLADISFFYR
ncbi:MAG: hypothetical protein K6E27_12290 [Eubacterium sp.]|nr:hypothetical protein [Eubacterium sp.]